MLHVICCAVIVDCSSLCDDLVIDVCCVLRVLCWLVLGVCCSMLV